MRVSSGGIFEGVSGRGECGYFFWLMCSEAVCKYHGEVFLKVFSGGRECDKDFFRMLCPEAVRIIWRYF